MEFKVSHRYLRISGRKVRYVVDLVRGLSVNDALQTLKFVNRRPKEMVVKLIRSAVANAGEIDPNIDADGLYISRIVVEDGPLQDNRIRFRPRSRGMANPIRKRTCHIKMSLSTRPDDEPTAQATKKTRLAAKEA